MTTIDPHAPCPRCPDGHDDPLTKPWSAWVTTTPRSDGTPASITVAPSDGSHVAESDAEWIRHVLRTARLAAESTEEA